MFAGMEILAVKPGTEVEHRGEKLTVTETQAVYLGRKIYMTEKQVAALRSLTTPEVKADA
jgi:hypothetical protein